MSSVPPRSEPITVVGIGADGWDGLGPDARAAVRDADVVLGGGRHLDAIGEVRAERVPWPSPLLPGLDELLERYRDARLCVVASGDPLLAGIGGTLVRRYGSAAVHVLPALSSATLARARLGWTAEETELVSAVGRDLDTLRRALAPGSRLLLLSAGPETPRAVVRLLVEEGYGASALTILEHLGGEAERRIDVAAREWVDPPVAALNIVAIDCVAEPAARPLPTVPGLPDDAFEHDGQITRREVRASTLAALTPLPGGLLWDIGSGSGSVAIEWCRAHPANRAVAIERDPARCARIERNAARLGVPGLRVHRGPAPGALGELDLPDAVFLGGGLTVDGLLPRCWDALRPGGRIVANGVTVQAETLLAAEHAARGGELTRMAFEHAAPLGGFTGWSPARTVTQWRAYKGGDAR